MMTTRLMVWLRAGCVALTLAAAACSDSPRPTSPSPAPIPVPQWPVRVSLLERESQAVAQTNLTITLESVQWWATSCLPNVPCPAFFPEVGVTAVASGAPALRTRLTVWDGAPPEVQRFVYQGYVVRLVKLTETGAGHRADLEIAPE